MWKLGDYLDTISLCAQALNADQAHCQQKPEAVFGQIYICVKAELLGEEWLIGSNMKSK